MKAISKKPIRLKSGGRIEAGTEFIIGVRRENPRIAQLVTKAHPKDIYISSAILHQYFDEFDSFGDSELQQAMMDGRCPSLTGEDVEPDGWDSHGFPSILMAVGIV